MTTEAPATRLGRTHEGVLYSSDDELLGVVVPFLREGVEAGEPTLVALNDRAADSVRTAMGPADDVTFLDPLDRRHDPASTIRRSREILAAYVAGGAEQIRIVGEVPHPGVGSPWEWWARYEAAINHAYAEFPLWRMCPYDLRITPDAVLDDVARTHPRLVTSEGSPARNALYEDPRTFLLGRPPTAADPLESASPPMFDLLDPSPAQARRAARIAGEVPPAGALDVDDVVMGVNEAVTNALAHGLPPVHVRIWAAPDRVVVTVCDHGGGPGDPFAGLLPTSNTDTGGLGLWMTHQMCSHVTFDRGDAGFTIRLVFDAAMLAAPVRGT